jgi:hypothetical protein
MKTLIILVSILLSGCQIQQFVVSADSNGHATLRYQGTLADRKQYDYCRNIRVIDENGFPHYVKDCR